MTQAKKRALFSFLIWGPVMVSFCFLFFAGGGPERFVVEKWRHIAGAVIIGAGYALNLVMLALTRARAGTPFDERDIANRRQANAAAFIVVLVYVFVLAIFLWETYEKRGYVPAGWMWFLAYSMSFVAYISSSVIALVLEARTNVHAQG